MSCRTAISGWSIPAICLLCFLFQSTPAAAQATSGQITAIPVYVYSSEGPFYFYTTDSSEGMALEASSKGKWSYQGILGYVAPRQLPGTIPLYKLIKKYDNSPRPKRQYTRSPKQLELLTHIGWKLEGSILYISATQVPGTFPIYRAEFPETGQRLDTTGHFSLAPEGYLWSKPVPLDVIHTENQHTPDLKDQLFSQGCSKIQGKPGDIECPTEIGLQLCENARKQGQMKITACHTRLNQAAFAKVQSDLFSRGCSSFLAARANTCARHPMETRHAEPI